MEGTQLIQQTHLTHNAWVNTDLHGVILETLKFVERICETRFRPLNARFTRQSELDRLLATEPNTKEEIEK